MTTPSNAELRKAIKQILQPLAASVASKTLGIDGRRAYRLKAERELVALFQAREQHPSTSRGYLMGYKAGQQQLLTEARLSERVWAYKNMRDHGTDPQWVEIAKLRMERLQNKTNDGGS